MLCIAYTQRYYESTDDEKYVDAQVAIGENRFEYGPNPLLRSFVYGTQKVAEHNGKGCDASQIIDKQDSLATHINNMRLVHDEFQGTFPEGSNDGSRITLEPLR